MRILGLLFLWELANRRMWCRFGALILTHLPHCTHTTDSTHNFQAILLSLDNRIVNASLANLAYALRCRTRDR